MLVDQTVILLKMYFTIYYIFPAEYTFRPDKLWYRGKAQTDKVANIFKNYYLICIFKNVLRMGITSFLQLSQELTLAGLFHIITTK